MKTRKKYKSTREAVGLRVYVAQWHLACKGEDLSSSPSRAEKKSGGAQLRKAPEEHFRKKVVEE